ncbi:hypothetical protein CHUAL_002314 [Chamberlinius hualienensis]
MKPEAIVIQGTEMDQLRKRKPEENLAHYVLYSANNVLTALAVDGNKNAPNERTSVIVSQFLHNLSEINYKSRHTDDKNMSFFIGCAATTKDTRFVNLTSRGSSSSNCYEDNVEDVAEFIENFKMHSYFLKRFSTMRLHLVKLPIENLDHILDSDITSNYHKIIVWSNESNMKTLVFQALSSNLFKLSITWLFIGQNLPTIFDETKYDYGEESYIASINCIGDKIAQPIYIELLNGIIHFKSESRQVGSWSKPAGLRLHSTSLPILQGTVLNVAVREEKPFFYFERDRRGNVTAKGMITDLLTFIEIMLNIRFNVSVPKEKNSGTVNENGQWNGLIGLLQRREVDMVAADVSLTQNRRKVADFSPPFLMTSIGIAVKSKQVTFAGYLSLPFAVGVWILIATATILTTILLTASCSWSPSGKNFPKLSRDKGPPGNFFGCLFVTVSLLTQQAFLDLPRSTSAKVIFIVHCIFAFLILESYASVLTASLSSNFNKPPFTTLNELVDNHHYTFGIREGSSNVEYLKTSNSSVLRKAWQRISSSPSNFCNSTVLGLHKALTESFAYIDNYATLKYHLSSNCNLKVLKQGRAIRGYYFAFTKNSPFLKRVSNVFLKLSNAGILNLLKNRHFKIESNCNNDADNDNGVHFQHISGLISFLFMAYLGALLILLFENVVKRHQKHFKFLHKIFQTHKAKDMVHVSTRKLARK